MNNKDKTWDLVNFCEFDKYAVKSYCAIHDVDESLNLGDITKVNENELEPFTMIVGGSPCFEAGTLILTKDGYKPIEDVKIGDLVLTHTGRFQKVLKVGSKVADTVELHCRKMSHTRVTLNHPYYTLRDGKIDWIEVSELRSGDYLAKSTTKDRLDWLPFKGYDNLLSNRIVYNLEVENDNSYTANNFIVHNCQDFSVAGKQKGSVWKCKNCEAEYNPLTVHWSKRDECPYCGEKEIDKSRSSLLVEWLRIIRANKPNFGIYENVKNIVGKQFKETTFKMFEQELQEYGYNTYWKVLNAKDYGIPQNRERVYLILIKKELDNGQFKFPEPFDNGIRLKDILELKVDEKYYVSDDKVARLLTNLNNKNSLLYDTCEIKREGRAREYNEFSPTLRAKDCKDPIIINDNMVKQLGNIVDTGNWDNPQRGRIYSPDGCSPALNTCGGGGLEPKIIQMGKLSSSQDGVIVHPDGISKTHTAGHNNMPKIVCQYGMDKSTNDTKYIDNSNCITSREDRGSSNRKSEGTAVLEEIRTSDISYCVNVNHDACIDNNVRIRKLTPNECFRLMGFSDQDFKKAEKVVSNSQLYKQSGNSIVVDVLYYILVELYKTMPYLFDDLKLSSYFSGIGAFECALNSLYKGVNTGNFTRPQSRVVNDFACGEERFGVNPVTNESWLKDKYEEFYSKHGYYPKYFVPYNCQEIKNYAPTLTANSNTSPTHTGTVLISMPTCAAIRGRYDENGKTVQQLEVGSNEYINCLTTVQKDNAIIIQDIENRL